MTEPSKTASDTPLTLSQPQVEDVFSATEQVRAADFATVPAELLTAVLAAERDNPDNRIAAARAVGRAVDSWLDEHPYAPPAAADPETAEGEGTP